MREELASLRKEFKLSQQMAWQGAGLSRSLHPLRNALQEAAIPVALRALLVDSIQSFEDVEPAIEEIRRQLVHSMQHSSVALPETGVHVLAGPFRCWQVFDGGAFGPTRQCQFGQPSKWRSSATATNVQVLGTKPSC